MLSVSARQRWNLLASTILKGSKAKEEKLCGVSLRHFNGFGIFRSESDENDESGVWRRWSLNLDEGLNDTKSVLVKILSDHISATELIGFNNTGNVCVWPSEEILAHYCVKHKELFSGKRICELGAGMTGLAGLFLACNVDASLVHLTDGNEKSVNNMHAVVNRNLPYVQAKKIEVSTLFWSTHSDLSDIKSKFDFIICSDCLFFEESHDGLLHVITRILDKEGLVIMFTPRRGKSAENFIRLASDFFDITVTENYDDLIWERHLKLLETPEYDPDRHFSVQLTMKYKT